MKSRNIFQTAFMAIIIITMLVAVASGQDNTYLPSKKSSPQKGDTVIVSVIGHGAQVGIARAFWKKFIYVDFITKCCNGWYDPELNSFFPYSKSWTDINYKLKSNGNQRVHKPRR